MTDKPIDDKQDITKIEAAGLDASEYKIPKELIIVPLKDLVVFPSMVVTVYVRNHQLIDAISQASAKKETIGVITQKDPRKPVPPMSNLHEVGTAASILQVIKGSSGDEAMVLVEGVARFKVQGFVQETPYIKAKIELIKQAGRSSLELSAMVEELKSLIRKASLEGKALPQEFLTSLETVSDAEQAADLACSYLTLSLEKKQDLLSIDDPKVRMAKIIDFLNKEIQLLKIRKKIHTDISKEMNKTERDYLLRQELKAIKKELGDKDNAMGGLEGMTDEAEMKELKTRIKAADMPPEVEKVATQELERLKKIITISPEFNVSRTYIEWLCDMPWKKGSAAKIDVKTARKILDEDHFGLEKIKERILEYLSVFQLKGNTSGSTILCFVGPPGVGKTSLGQSIARALGRPFIHTSLGGIRDEADMRGHRRTYVGALPGRIIQSIKRAGVNDPVFMLDEIDKIGKDFQGDPAAALMEALDPEQNFAFTDHYLDVPFDLSRVFFILTANITDPIVPALLDRMEVIELPGYTEEEKLQIAQKYLLPKQLKINGLEKQPFTMTDEAILKIVRAYTGEAGLRDLERQIASICRKIAKEIVEKKAIVKDVGSAEVEKYLGVEKYEYEVKQREDMVGVATGLAWTPSGGDIIFIEAAKMKGSKNLILTGSLGDVMQESARAALSFIRSHSTEFGINDSVFEKSDIHIHVPEGATPKDGPSAGITICTALISLMTNRKVRRDVAMTGEVTLTGRILPIGGLKEKLLAAKRAGIHTIIIPERNRKDLVEIPKRLLKNIDIRFAKTLEDVVKIAVINAKTPTVPPQIKTRIVNLPAKKTALVRVVKMSALKANAKKKRM
jgi:ATP-dependent Lon protease